MHLLRTHNPTLNPPNNTLHPSHATPSLPLFGLNISNKPNKTINIVNKKSMHIHTDSSLVDE
jgi:hypothetical protein